MRSPLGALVADLPSEVRRHMVRRGLSYLDLSIEADLTPSVVWEALTGRSDPRMSTLIKLANWAYDQGSMQPPSRVSN